MNADFKLLILDKEHGLTFLSCNLLQPPVFLAAPQGFLAANPYIRPMFRYLEIIWASFKMALQEFRSNKLRTFLSLLGITFGIFCIISVLSTISSMQLAVNNDLKSFGNKTIYIDKWQYSGGPDFPWWKYVKRPVPKFEEARLLRLKVPEAPHIDFEMDNSGNVDYGDNSLTGVQYY